ncbi:MAG: DUF3606 domain-containing protein [Sphingobacteriales bacterium]|nr:MAG: DUF3606 domain-containing protein [Sphingobacteriales bacterium]
MPDNKNKRDGRDRSRVSGSEYYELRYMAEKYGVSTQQVSGAIRAVGNDRKKVEAYIKERSR